MFWVKKKHRHGVGKTILSSLPFSPFLGTGGTCCKCSWNCVVCPGMKCYKHCLSSKLRLRLKGLHPSLREAPLLTFTQRQQQHLFSVVCVDEVHSAFVESDPSMPDFCHPDILVTWQQPAPESDWDARTMAVNSRDSQGSRKNPRWLLDLSSSLENPVVGVCIPSLTTVRLRKTCKSKLSVQPGDYGYNTVLHMWKSLRGDLKTGDLRSFHHKKKKFHVVMDVN